MTGVSTRPSGCHPVVAGLCLRQGSEGEEEYQHRLMQMGQAEGHTRISTGLRVEFCEQRGFINYGPHQLTGAEAFLRDIRAPNYAGDLADCLCLVRGLPDSWRRNQCVSLDLHGLVGPLREDTIDGFESLSTDSMFITHMRLGMQNTITIPFQQVKRLASAMCRMRSLRSLILDARSGTGSSVEENWMKALSETTTTSGTRAGPLAVYVFVGDHGQSGVGEYRLKEGFEEKDIKVFSVRYADPFDKGNDTWLRIRMAHDEQETLAALAARAVHQRFINGDVQRSDVCEFITNPESLLLPGFASTDLRIDALNLDDCWRNKRQRLEGESETLRVLLRGGWHRLRTITHWTGHGH